MIRINLALKKGTLATGGGAAKGGMDFKEMTKVITKLDIERAREVPAFKVLFNLILAAAAYFLLQSYKEDQLKKWDDKSAILVKEQNRLTTEIQKYAQMDQALKDLEAEKVSLQGKYEVIQHLVRKRAISSRLLLQLATSLPKDLWLRELKSWDKELTLAGYSTTTQGTGFDAITDFIGSLNTIGYLSEVKLLNTQKEKDEKGQEVAAFQVSARRK